MDFTFMKTENATGEMAGINREEYPICVTCGTQYQADRMPERCNICDDPRQFVPAGGQAWTTSSELKRSHRNEITVVDGEDDLWIIQTTPRFGIGQRAFLIKTEHGNVFWDCISLLDENTIKFINAQGGLVAMVISHPHFYSSHAMWADIFNCPVYTSIEDAQWLKVESSRRQFIEGKAREILPDVTAYKAGGHFDGSLVLHWASHKKLFVADTLVPIPSGNNPSQHRGQETTSFTFMWSYPNMIQLGPDEIAAIWDTVKGLDFEAVYGPMAGFDIKGNDLGQRLLQSMKIMISRQGWLQHRLMKEEACA